MGNFRHRFIGNTMNIYSKVSSLEGSYRVLTLVDIFFDCMNFNEEGLVVKKKPRQIYFLRKQDFSYQILFGND